MSRKVKLSEIESFTTSFPVSSGGTGATSFAANAILYGNGTSAVQADSNFTWDSSKLNVKKLVTPEIRIEDTDTALVNGQVIGKVSYYQNDASTGGTGVAAEMRVTSVWGANQAMYEGNAVRFGIMIAGDDDPSPSMGGLIEALSIHQGGEVTVGTTDAIAGALFSVDGDMTVGSTSNASAEVRFFDSSQSGTTRVRSNSSGLVFLTANSDRMVIDSSGNVGINTGAPSTLLDINSGVNSGTQALLTLGGTNASSAKTNYVQFKTAVQDNTAASEDAGFSIDILRNGSAFNALNYWINVSEGWEFRTAGASAMVINSSQQVGIGNTSPGTSLEIGDGTGQEILTINYLGGAGGLLYFEDNGSLDWAVGAHTSGSINNDFVIDTALNPSASKFIVKTSGNIGLGTNSPINKLDVRTSSTTLTDRGSTVAIEESGTWNQGLAFYLNNADLYAGDEPSAFIGVANSSARLIMSAGTRTVNNPAGSTWGNPFGTTGSFLELIGNEFKFYGDSGLTAGVSYTPTQRMILDADGDLGVGVASPSYRVDVDGDVNITGDFRVNGVVQGVGSLWTAGAGSAIYRSSGNVGIGTTSPSRLLDVENSGGNAFVSVVSGTSNDAAILLGDTDSDARGQLYYRNADDSLAIYVGGSERARLISGGLLGLNTTNPKVDLQTINSGGIQALNDTEIAFRYNMYNNAGDKYIQASNAAASMVMNSSGDVIFYSTATASTAADSAVTGLRQRLLIDSTDGTVLFGTPGVETAKLFSNDSMIFRTDSDNGGGNVTFNFQTGAGTDLMVIESGGDVGIGIANPTHLLHVKETSNNTTVPNLVLDSIVQTGYEAGRFEVRREDNLVGAFGAVWEDNDNSWARIGIRHAGSTVYPLVVRDNRVGMGTSSPDAPLHVEGGVTTTLAKFSAESGGDALSFAARAATNGTILASTIDSLADYSPLEIYATSIDFRYRTTFGNSTSGMTLDTSGNVNVINELRVGTSTPVSGSLLTVDGDMALGSTSNALAEVRFFDSSQSGTTRVRSNSDGLIFLTANANRMTVFSSGQVSINQSSAGSTARLTVGDGAKAGSGTPLILESTDATDPMRLYVQRGTNSYFSFQALEENVAYRDIVFNLSGGNVGIGTSSPSDLLEVKKASGTGTAFSVTNSSDVRVASMYVDQSQGGLIVAHDNVGTNKVFLSSYSDSYFTGGGVGIGTSSITEKLQIENGNMRIYGTTGNDVSIIMDNQDSADIKSVNFNGGGALHAKIGVGGTSGDIIADSTGQDLSLMTNGGGRAINFSVDGTTTHMKVAGTSGNVLIGHTSSATGGGHRFQLTGQSSGVLTADSDGTGMWVGTYSASKFSIQTNNSRRLTIDGTTGRVGINDTDPDSILAIKATGTNDGIRLRNSSDQSRGYLIVTPSNNGYLALQNSSTLTRVILDAGGNSGFVGGNLGVGTFGPQSAFHAHNASGDSFFQATVTATGSTASDGGRFGFFNGSTVLTVQNQEAGGVQFYTGSTQRMFLDNSGNFALRTSDNLSTESGARFQVSSNSDSTPDTLLYHASASVVGPALRMRKARGTHAARTAILSGDLLGAITWDGQFDSGSNVSAGASIITSASQNWSLNNYGTYMQFYTTPTGTNSQQLHLQLNNDGSLLHIVEGNSGSSVTALQLNNKQSATGTASDILFALNNGSATAQIRGEIAGGSNQTDMSFWTRTGTTLTEAMRIDDAQNVGIGTTSPGRRLTVSRLSSNAYISVISNNALSAGILFGDGGSDSVGRVVYNNGFNRLEFYTNGTRRSMINNDGSMYFNTDAGYGAANTKFVFNESSSGQTPGFALRATAGTSGITGIIDFVNGSDSNRVGASIYAISDGAVDRGRISWYNRNGAGIAANMHLRYTGQLDVGTSTPGTIWNTAFRVQTLNNTMSLATDTSNGASMISNNTYYSDAFRAINTNECSQVYMADGSIFLRTSSSSVTSGSVITFRNNLVMRTDRVEIAGKSGSASVGNESLRVLADDSWAGSESAFAVGVDNSAGNVWLSSVRATGGSPAVMYMDSGAARFGFNSAPQTGVGYYFFSSDTTVASFRASSSITSTPTIGFFANKNTTGTDGNFRLAGGNAFAGTDTEHQSEIHFMNGGATDRGGELGFYTGGRPGSASASFRWKIDYQGNLLPQASYDIATTGTRVQTGYAVTWNQSSAFTMKKDFATISTSQEDQMATDFMATDFVSFKFNHQGTEYYKTIGFVFDAPVEYGYNTAEMFRDQAGDGSFSTTNYLGIHSVLLKRSYKVIQQLVQIIKDNNLDTQGLPLDDLIPQS